MPQSVWHYEEERIPNYSVQKMDKVDDQHNQPDLIVVEKINICIGGDICYIFDSYF